MGTFDSKFRSVKPDQSPYLFHFTKGTAEEAKNAMNSIIEHKKLISKSTDYVCFTATPITAMHRFFKTTVNRTGLPMYQPFGIGFARDILVRDFGARNVIYCDEKELKLIDDNFKWRSEPLIVNTYDFEYLREWRIRGKEFDFSEFPQEHIIIIAPHLDDLNDLVSGHDLVFRPFVDYVNGDIEPDWDEVFPRIYKGLSLDAIKSGCTDDYQVSGATLSQKIDEDMLSAILKGYADREQRKKNNHCQ